MSEWTDSPICPHCGHEDHEAWEHDFRHGIDTMTVECEACGKPYRLTQDFTVTYSTEPVAEPEDSTT